MGTLADRAASLCYASALYVMYIQSTENKHIMMNICSVQIKKKSSVKMTSFYNNCHFCFKSTSTTHNINVNDTAMILYLITAHVVADIHNNRLSPIVTFSYIQTLL